jgi:hypothetical protein
MNLRSWYPAALIVLTSAVSVEAQAPGLRVDEDDITIRGCVTRAERYQPINRMPLVWSRNDILVSIADGMSDRARSDNPSGRLLYYLDDEDLTEHIGRIVEIEGDLEDVKKGEVEIERKDDFTTIELKFAGRTERARIPTPWFATARSGEDRDYQVVVQRVDVENVRVVGTCDR